MICKKCHKEIPEGSLYCNFCGKKQETTKRKKAKRATGTGSIMIDSRNKNMYRAYAPSDRFGRHRKYLGCYKTYADAQTALERYSNDNISDLYNYTISRLYEEWSATHFETLTKNGIQGYKTAYKYLENIYNRKVRELKTVDYQECIDICSEKYSRAMCEKVKQLCSQLCKYAMQNDIIDKNYAEFVKLPKQEKKERQTFSHEDIALLWENAADERVQQILIMIYTGFRIGEICNIKKSNVNLQENYIIAGEKTKAGIDRYVPIQADIKPFVDSLYNNSTSDKLIDMDIKTFRNNVFYSALSDLGLINKPTKNEKTGKLEYKDPAFTPHCTRHTFATLCVESGIDPKSLQKIIGHAKFETTADIYVHENTEELQNAISKLKVR